MKKKVFATALAVGVAWDILFWQKVPGINFPLLVLICLIVGFFLLGSEKIKTNSRNLWLLVPIGFFAAMSVVRRDPLTSFLNYTLSLLFIAILAATYQSGKWISFSILDYLASALLLFVNTISLPWKMIGEASKNGNGENRKRRSFLPILRGFLLAIPILAIFILLFSSADQIFADKFEVIIEWINIENLGEIIAQMIFIFIMAYLFTGVVQYAANKSQREKLIGAEKAIVQPFLGFTESTIVLGSVILLFSAFVTIQFRYFFAGQANIQLDGFTYAEYARRGFGELVTVAVFSLLLIQILKSIVKKEAARKQSIFKWMIAGLAGLVLIILVSAFQRLSLYESAYGFTSLRTYAHVFMAWLGVLLAGTVLLEILNKGRIFSNLALAALVCFGTTLNLLNVDAFIVRQNIARSVNGADLDAAYLSSLSSDALPVLVAEFRSQEVPEEIRERIGGALACYQERHYDPKRETVPWQSMHFSQLRAGREMTVLKKYLESYQAVDGEWGCEIKSPSGEIINCCYSTSWD